MTGIDHDTHGECRATVAFLLEDIPSGRADWRFRLRLQDGAEDGWIEVEGRGKPLEAASAEALVVAHAQTLPRERRLEMLLAMSPLVVGQHQEV